MTRTGGGAILAAFVACVLAAAPLGFMLPAVCSSRTHVWPGHGSGAHPIVSPSVNLSGGAPFWSGAALSTLGMCAVASVASKVLRKATGKSKTTEGKGGDEKTAAEAIATASADIPTSATSAGLVWGMSGDFGPWPGQVGASMPLVDHSRGMDRWDPLGLSTGKNADKFDRYRAAEVKHGRVAMMAIVGLVVQHSYRFPFAITGTLAKPVLASLQDVPFGSMAALNTSPASETVGILFLLAGWFEIVLWKPAKGAAPGDLGDPARLAKMSLFEYTDFNGVRAIEIEHGRLAMMGFLGAMSAELVTGYDAVDQWYHIAEALRGLK